MSENSKPTKSLRDAKKVIKADFPKIYQRFGSEKDTQGHMTAASVKLSDDLTAFFSSLTDEQAAAVADVLHIIKSAVPTVGHKRIFGHALPAFAANLLVGPPTE